MHERPETIEGRWDILYRDYPEVYEEFSSYPYSGESATARLSRRFGLDGKVVLDVGSGAGASTLGFARFAAHVIGIEPERAMREAAERAAREAGVTNVEFREGSSGRLPVVDHSVDAAMLITAPAENVAELVRVVRSPGVIAAVEIPPGWYGGEMCAVIGGDGGCAQRHFDRLVGEHGFSFEDTDTVQEFGMTDNIVRTYGFIHGRNAIEHLKRTGQTSIRWRFRTYYLET